MSNDEFSSWYSQLQQHAIQNRWRNLVVLAGESDWINQRLKVVFSAYDPWLKAKNSAPVCGLNYRGKSSVLVAQNLIPVNRKTYGQYLGTEQQVVIFPISKCEKGHEIASDFDVDAFAALSGTIISGGVLVLTIVTNAEVELPQFDCFLQRFWQLLNAGNSYIVRQNDQPSSLIPMQNVVQADVVKDKFDIGNNAGDIAQDGNLPALRSLRYGCITQEQVLAVEASLKVLYGHRNRPLVLTADRGRGKSSALALAACEMLLNAKQKLKIVLTASSRDGVNIFFSQVASHLPGAILSANAIAHDNGEIVFLPIDSILKDRPVANIVMVDEAAAFPIYLLHELLKQYHRLVFASTVHGYEGAGRGFSIKFRSILNKLRPQWRELHIHEPIRWAADDPLEAFVFSSCLLNASLPKYPENSVSNEQLQACRVLQLSANKLLADEILLQQVFAVLVTAHYQTTPSDMKLLLDNPAISLFVLKHDQEIIGVAMLICEGQIDSELAELVRDGKRRLRDQFLPQSLLTHCGIKDSFEYSYQRVMRIAIHPQFQGQGLGQYFLTNIEKRLSVLGSDFIGSSFAGNATLLSFWQQSGFSLARIGFNKDKASGEHSCLVLKPLSGNAVLKQHEISKRFYQQFDYWLTDELKELPAKLVWQVLHHRTFSQTNSFELSREHQQAVEDFISGQRQFSSCVYGLHHWLLQHCLNDFDAEVLPLITRIFQKHSIELVCASFGFTGKKALNQHLINTIAKYQI